MRSPQVMHRTLKAGVLHMIHVMPVVFHQPIFRKSHTILVVTIPRTFNLQGLKPMTPSFIGKLLIISDISDFT